MVNVVEQIMEHSPPQILQILQLWKNVLQEHTEVELSLRLDGVGHVWVHKLSPVLLRNKLPPILLILPRITRLPDRDF